VLFGGFQFFLKKLYEKFYNFYQRNV